MEPTLPTPHGSPEMGPSLPRGPEGLRPHGSEHQYTPEVPAPQEQRTGAAVGDTPPPTIPAMPPLPVQGATTTVPTAPVISDSPHVAADEDLIEKEWVERAKKAVSETKDDPYAQEKAIRKLQADYLNKRYGKVIKLPAEE